MVHCVVLPVNDYTFCNSGYDEIDNWGGFKTTVENGSVLKISSIDSQR